MRLFFKSRKIVYAYAEKFRQTNQIAERRLARIVFPQTYDRFAYPYRFCESDLP